MCLSWSFDKYLPFYSFLSENRFRLFQNVASQNIKFFAQSDVIITISNVSIFIPVELATIMDRLYGCVCYAGIDTDPELKYPKGAGRVAFSNQQSYIAAISARFVQLQHGDIDKRVSADSCQYDISMV